MSLFRTITAGIRFDKQKYRHEAEKFGLVKKQPDNGQEDTKAKISLESDLIPDSNLPTPDESDEDTHELQLLGNTYSNFGKYPPKIREISRKVRKVFINVV